MVKNYQAMAEQILEKVGGTQNVTFATHCMTRLRLNVKDKDTVDVDAIKKISGVLGSQFSGEQFQIIIGQDVPKLYAVVCDIGGFAKQAAVDEELDKTPDKKTFSLAQVGNSIMDALTGCLSPIIPVLMIAGMLKMAVAVFGPDMLGILAPESDLFRLLSFLGDACFYFFPVMVGYTGAQKFGASPVLGILLGGVLLHPTLIEIVNTGDPFTVFGLPMTLASYSSTVIPMVLITWILSYVEKFFKKYTPSVLSTVFAPLLTFIVMTPLALCVLGPAGTILGNYFTNGLISLYDAIGPLAIAIIGALYLPLVATGMHMPLVTYIMLSFATFGYDAVIFPGACVAIYVDIAIDLALAIKAKNAEDRSLGISCLVAQALGGVGEPTIFGVLFRFKKALAWSIAGCFCGALTVGLLQAKFYLLPASNALMAVGYGTDLIKGIAGCAVGFIVSFVLMMVFGYEDKKSS